MLYLKDLNLLLQTEPVYRQKQALDHIFSKLSDNWLEASNLQQDLKISLNRDFPLSLNYESFPSKIDGTLKVLLHLVDGLSVEAVLMRSKRGRNTICLSSQVGCPLGCSFCATGQMGFKRNLTDWEICQQVLLFARILKPENQKISNVVFMGMGEPMLNYANVLSAIKTLNNKDALGLGSRRFSI
jgi:23S rRNA (adenine2503-C2)-methyltransferase